ncbi:hypothetical protein [Pseudostreptobacillus hongkongensis]|uniref:hypothetical protein n=1 Tax=Pseudostreptobacillus hongkongensis TaxID=1162717 RepID=UPI00082A3383|nr:hypothetical protein [Pseudostreptobacillus hongkongensis]
MALSDYELEMVAKLTDQVTPVLNKINKELSKELPAPKVDDSPLKKLYSSFINLTSSVQGLAAVYAGSKLVGSVLNFGKACLSASSDMTELQNVTDQVFGQMADDVQQFAEKSGVEMGRSIYAMKKYVSDMGAVIKGLGGFDTSQIKEMSENLASLAVDIGSFKNIDDEQAFNALRGGIVGETEALKTLGIVINDTVMAEYARNKGIKEKWVNLDASTKAELRYQALLEKTSFMQGDAARTIDSYANQLKVFEANMNNITTTIGNKFTNATAGALSGINNLLSGLNDLLNQKGVDDYWSQFIDESEHARNMVEEYINLSKKALDSSLTSEEESKRLSMYEELKSLYPDIIGSISSEASEYQKVADSLDDINSKLKQKVLMQLNEDNMKEFAKTQQKEYEKIAGLKQDIQKELANFQKAGLDLKNGVTESLIKDLDKFKHVKLDDNKALETAMKDIKEILKQHGEDGTDKQARILLDRIAPLTFKIDRINNQITKSEDVIKAGLEKSNLKSEALKNMLGDYGVKTGDLLDGINDGLHDLHKLGEQTKNDLKSNANKNTADLSKKINQDSLSIIDNQGRVQEVITGHTTDRSIDEIFEIQKVGASVSAFVNGVNTTFKNLGDGKYEVSTGAGNKDSVMYINGEKVFTNQTKIMSEQEAKKLLQKNYKIQAPQKQQISRSSSNDSKSKSKGKKDKKESGTKEKTYADKLKDINDSLSKKWEDILLNLEKTIGELNLRINSDKLKTILEKTKKVHELNLENIANFSNNGFFNPLETLQEQLKAYDDYIKQLQSNFKYTNDKSLQDKIKQEIENTKKQSEKVKLELLEQTTLKNTNELNLSKSNGWVDNLEYLNSQLNIYNEKLKNYQSLFNEIKDESLKGKIKTDIDNLKNTIKETQNELKNETVIEELRKIIDDLNDVYKGDTKEQVLNLSRELANKKKAKIDNRTDLTDIQKYEEKIKVDEEFNTNVEKVGLYTEKINISASNYILNIKKTFEDLKDKIEKSDKSSELDIEFKMNDTISDKDYIEKLKEKKAKIDEEYKTLKDSYVNGFDNLDENLKFMIDNATGTDTLDKITNLLNEHNFNKEDTDKLTTLKTALDKMKNASSKSIELKEAIKKAEELKKMITEYVQFTFENIKKAFKNIVKNSDDSEVGGELLDLFSNKIAGVASFATGDIAGGVKAIVNEFVDMGSRLVGILFGDNKAEKAKKDYEARSKELDDNTRALRELRDTMKDIQGDLVKSASENTSNKNLELYKNMSTEMNKVFANNFNPKVLMNGVAERSQKRGFWNGLLSIFTLGVSDLISHKRENVAYAKNFSDVMKFDAQNSTDLEKIYNEKIKNLNSEDLKKFLDKEGGAITQWDLVDVNSNLDQIKQQFLNKIQDLRKQEQETEKFYTNAIYESFEGVSTIDKKAKKKEMLDKMKSLAKDNDDLEKMIPEFEKKIDEMLDKEDKIVTAFNETRESITKNLSDGKNVIESLANGLGSYFGKLRNNLAKIKYDLEFRELDGLETKFEDKFKEVAEALVKIRLESGKTLKDLDPKHLDFSSLFKQLKDTEKVSSDMRDIIQELRKQAKMQGISDEMIDQMLPLDKITNKAQELSDILKQAMTVAIDTNSFEQFNMSIGDGIYKSAKDALIKSFSESSVYQNLIKKYMNTEDMDQKLSGASTLKEAYETIKKELDNFETKLKSEGLGFRETNASSGEYLGGMTNKSLPSSNIVSKGIDFKVEVNIDNRGFLAVEDLTKTIFDKFRAEEILRKSKEV